VSDDTSGAPPEVPIEPEPPVGARSRSSTILFAVVLAATAAGLGWFAFHLTPRTPAGGSAAVAAPDTLVPDSVQIIRPRPISKMPAEITAADLPGFDTEGLTPGQMRWLYHHARLEQCSCGCGWNVAECRINDPNCPKSPGRAKELVAEAKQQKI
jgi:hypothetical protein